ncbi:hypothetical protein CAS74_003922 [Pichia kudriavzevii]|uniref:Glycerophosphodiester phosphodiesterase GDE1 n=1 Tax=Pichia kudriavzevii TaxID=4909 RepID=A0A1Z8JK08_PICKU|nr:hypothetical protein CAS74_003922 [Pichia kudriavzevii]
MKFGHTLLTHQIPEWQGQYMDYKSLKKIVKAIHSREIELRNEDSNVDVFNDGQVKTNLANFFFQLDNNVEKVDEFYTKKYLDYEKRLKKISGAFPKNVDDIGDNEEYDELVDILLELRNCFRNLKWYAELNRRGFEKILKKLDKKAGTEKQQEYLKSKVYSSSFCDDTQLVNSLTKVNEFLNILASINEQHSAANNSNNHYKSSQNINNASNSTSSSISNFDITATLNDLNVSDLNKFPIPTSASPIMKAKSNIKKSNLDPYIEFILKDDVKSLEQKLTKEYMSPVLAPIKLLLSMLNKSTLELSHKCIDMLLRILPVLSDSGDVSARNFIHHHVIALGKKNSNRLNSEYYDVGTNNKADYNSSLFNTFGSDGVNSNDFSQGLLYIFQTLPEHLKFAILQKDNYKRTPLHYAAQYGLKDVTNIIIRFLKEWNLYNESIPLDDVSHWGDSENLTPLHLSILGKHPKTTETLVNSMSPDVSLSCPYLLHVATRMNTKGLLKSILGCKGIDINSFETNEFKETALYIACKHDLMDSVKALLAYGADTEIGEATFGWTPIFVAAANGFIDIINLLIEHGANIDIQDESGWTPREHAALRGHIEIIEKLTPPNYNPYDSLLPENKITSPKLSPRLIGNNSSNSSIHTVQANRIKTPEPTNDRIDLKILQHGNNSTQSLVLNGNSNNINTNNSSDTIVGNTYLRKGESTILVTIGTTDSRDITPALELNKIPLSKIHSTELDSALSIVIHTSCKSNDSVYSLPLPLDDNHGSSMDPIIFQCKGEDPLNTIIYFDIVPTFDIEVQNKDKGFHKKSDKILGRGVAILKNIHTPVGKGKRSLFNSAKIPILESHSMEVLGNIKFETLIVKSFEDHFNIPANADIYWKSLVHPRLIGHRGNGMNQRDKKSLQLGENTVESFIAAASLGAQYVEFDVQLTKDDIPVIYHDFIIAESGIDIPMNSLTLEQFMHLNLSKDNKGRDVRERRVKDDSYIPQRSRSRSISYNNGGSNNSNGGSNTHNYKEGNDEKWKDKYDIEVENMHERMKLTKTWKDKEFKANIRGSSIASSFTTLEELFIKLPPTVGFNIELKYPMLDESETFDIGQVSPELNHFCDVILEKVYSKYNGRNVIFSSFHPDICMIMTMKQPSFPVLFLTESGVEKMADIRASSLQNAIRFAKTWKLFGIVSHAVPFIHCPRLASVVKASGLACFTYGSANNDPINAKLEIAAGVDAVIVDSVLAVRKELTKFDEGKQKRG